VHGVCKTAMQSARCDDRKNGEPIRPPQNQQHEKTQGRDRFGGMRALIYARVSTADKEQDPGPQLEEMREHCRRRGWTSVGEFVESRSSSKIRPQFDAMMREARARHGDVVLCRHFDRIARSAKELIGLLDEFQALGVDFISVNQQIDTTTPMGRMFFQIVAAFAEFERAMTRERVRLGLQDAKTMLAQTGQTRKGKSRWAGRPRVMVDDDRIAALWHKEPNIEAIGRRLKVSPSTVRRRLETAGILQKPTKKPSQGKP
jgi:DNA invertase Pin-like site-specific DNA recombinase